MSEDTTTEDGTPETTESDVPVTTESNSTTATEGGDTPPVAEGDTPTPTEGDTPTETEGDTPTETEGDTPTETEGDTPTETEGDTPTETEGDTPTETEGDTPTETTEETPAEPPVPTLEEVLASLESADEKFAAVLASEKAEAEKLSVQSDLNLNATHTQKLAAHALKAEEMRKAYEAKVATHEAKKDGINSDHAAAREANVKHWEAHYASVEAEFKSEFDAWARDAKHDLDTLLKGWQKDGVAEDHKEEADGSTHTDVPTTETTGDTPEVHEEA